jgi:hypothetical protein
LSGVGGVAAVVAPHPAAGGRHPRVRTTVREGALVRRGDAGAAGDGQGRDATAARTRAVRMPAM